MLKIKDLMEYDIMKNAKILSGKKNLDNQIKSISVLEIPEKTSFIKEGELLISSFYSIRENIDKQIEVIHMLKEVKSSGLILSNINLTLDSVSEKLIEECNKLDFPLILAPQDLAYIDIIKPVIENILSNHNKKLEKTLKIYDRLLETMVDKQDLEKILKVLYEIIDTQLFFYDYNLNCIYEIGFHKETKNIKNIVQKQINDNLEKIMKKEDVYINNWLFSPVISTFKFYGILVISNHENLSNIDHIAITQAKNIISVVILNKINREDYQISTKKDFIIDLINNKPTDRNLTLKRGLGLGYQIDSVRLAMVLDIYKFNNLIKNKSEKEILKIKSEILKTVKDNLFIRSNEFIFIDHSDKIIILLYKYLDKENTIQKAFDVGNYLIKTIKNQNNIEVSLGVGGYYDNFEYIYRSFYEAQRAIDISNKIFSKPICTSYNDIEIYDILFKKLDYSLIEELLKKLFQPIIEYDNNNNSELLYTFSVFIENNLNNKITAEKLFIHENTVRQREDKIIKQLGFNPFIYPNFTKYKIAFLLKKYFEIQL